MFSAFISTHPKVRGVLRQLIALTIYLVRARFNYTATRHSTELTDHPSHMLLLQCLLFRFGLLFQPHPSLLLHPYKLKWASWFLAGALKFCFARIWELHTGRFPAILHDLITRFILQTFFSDTLHFYRPFVVYLIQHKNIFRFWSY